MKYGENIENKKKYKTPIVWIMRINASLFSETIYSLRTHTTFFLYFFSSHTHTHTIYFISSEEFFFCIDDALSNENFLLSHGKFFFYFFFHALKINFFHQKDF